MEHRQLGQGNACEWGVAICLISSRAGLLLPGDPPFAVFCNSRFAFYCHDTDLRTVFRKGAFIAFWLASVAHLSAMKDHAMTEIRPIFSGNQAHQVALDLDGVVMLGQSHAQAQASYVRIHGNAGHVKGIAEDDIRRLAPTPGNGTSSSMVPGTSPPN